MSIVHNYHISGATAWPSDGSGLHASGAGALRGRPRRHRLIPGCPAWDTGTLRTGSSASSLRGVSFCCLNLIDL